MLLQLFLQQKLVAFLRAADLDLNGEKKEEAEVDRDWMEEPSPHFHTNCLPFGGHKDFTQKFLKNTDKLYSALLLVRKQ